MNSNKRSVSCCKTEKNNYSTGNRFVWFLLQFRNVAIFCSRKMLNVSNCFCSRCVFFFLLLPRLLLLLLVVSVCVWYLADSPQIISSIVIRIMLLWCYQTANVVWIEIPLHNTWHFEAESLFECYIDVCTASRTPNTFTHTHARNWQCTYEYINGYLTMTKALCT